MGDKDKILIELDKVRIKEWCNLQRIYPSSDCSCSVCKQSDKEQIECMLMEGGLYNEIDYKIKEQDNEIKPKFKVGQKVYVIVKRYDASKPFCVVSGVIKHIQIRTKIIYSIYGSICGEDIFNTVYLGEENYCFATETEAQKECDRRNHEKGIY